ncbi:hypothetical protein [Flindersiella endophytica]
MRRVIAWFVAIAVVIGVVVAGANLLSTWLARPLVQDGCVARANQQNTELSFEQAENAALISAISVRRGLPARAATIAIATAFQETDIQNLDYGDRDSVGIFQQRPSMGWGDPEQLMDPYYATNKFYDHLVKIDGYETAPIDEAAQAVQRSADGTLYAQHEPDARALASSLTGQSPAAFSCTVADPPSEHDPAGLRSELARAFGSSATTSSSASSDTMTVPVASGTAAAARGWAMAHFALAYGRQFGVSTVSYAGQTWSAQQSDAGWQADEGAAANRIVIGFQSPE